MAYRKNHKTFSESRKKKKRTKRSRQVFRQKLFLCTVMMGSVVFLSAAAFQKFQTDRQIKQRTYLKKGLKLKQPPYILTILSDAYGELELLGDLVAAADQAHTALSDQETVESSVHIQ